MSESRFTAPVSGYYLFEPGRDPRLLTEAERAEVFDKPGAQTFHFWEGDAVMNSGARLAPEHRPAWTMAWGHE